MLLSEKLSFKNRKVCKTTGSYDFTELLNSGDTKVFVFYFSVDTLEYVIVGRYTTQSLIGVTFLMQHKILTNDLIESKIEI